MIGMSVAGLGFHAMCLVGNTGDAATPGRILGIAIGISTTAYLMLEAAVVGHVIIGGAVQRQFHVVCQRRAVGHRT